MEHGVLEAFQFDLHGRIPFMDDQSQKRAIRDLAGMLVKCRREVLVYESFVRELKAEGRLGIVEDLHRIRKSPETEKFHGSYLRSLEAAIPALGTELSDQSLEELIRLSGLDEAKSN